MANSSNVGIWNGARREMEDEGWKLVRTLRGGTKAMREAREVYTPRMDLEKRDNTRYERRLKRSVLYPAYDDRVESLASLPFQREPTIDGTLPEPLDRLLSDADRCGTSLAAFMQVIYQDAIDKGMGVFLVDNVSFDDLPLTEVDQIDARPYFLRVIPDNIVGFRTQNRAGREVVTEFRYREWSWEAGIDGYDMLVDRVRVWDEKLVTVWKRATTETSIDREEKAELSHLAGYVIESSRPHGFPGGIPLVVCYTNKVGTLHAKPALIALAWLNVAHWESCSIQGDALAYCRAPTRVIAGASSEVAEQKPTASTGATIIDTSPDFTMSFVEIAGTSLAAGEREIDQLRLMMEALGMRPMMSTQGPETATGEVRADMQEKSKAQSWVEALEWAIYKGFEKAATWLGMKLPDDFDVTLFKDSSLIAGKATDLPVLMQMAQGRLISLRSFLAEVKARGVTVTIDDVEEEVEAIRTEAEEAVQRQMDAMANRFIAEREAGVGPEDGSPGPGTVPPRRPQEEDEEDEGEEVVEE